MKIVTLNAPDSYLDCLEILVNLGFYPSRSEAIRQAIKEFLEREDDFMGGIDNTVFLNLKKQQAKEMRIL